MSKFKFITTTLVFSTSLSIFIPISNTYAAASCSTSGIGTRMATANCSAPNSGGPNNRTTGGENVNMTVICKHVDVNGNGRKSYSYYPVSRSTYISAGGSGTMTALCHSGDVVSSASAS